MNKDFKAFRKFLGNWGDLSWSYAAVRAPFDDVARELAAITGTTLHREVSIGPPKKTDTAETVTAIVEVKGSPWTVVVHAIGTWVAFGPTAAALASKLGAQVLVYEAEDTSGSEGLAVYAPGSVTHYATGDDSEYDDELREEAGIAPGPPREIVDGYDEVFAKLEVPFHQISVRNTKEIAAKKESLPQLGRACLLEHAS